MRRSALTVAIGSRSATDVSGRSAGRTGLVEELDGTEQHHQRQGDGEDVAAARPVEEDDHEPSRQDQPRAQRSSVLVHSGADGPVLPSPPDSAAAEPVDHVGSAPRRRTAACAGPTRKAPSASNVNQGSQVAAASSAR